VAKAIKLHNTKAAQAQHTPLLSNTSGRINAAAHATVLSLVMLVMLTVQE
jgi:hypothetical protein